ncbi:MAG TPA: hypothetical protein IAC50_01510 [Candidatus Copromorpha excrementigallinarum]|uniref:Uncharacterized protein n=1 Tax=Candidatus Allocopromorpha excrementigallinarum TaxID=2840742 RepID=A0A9D1HZ22_9FIRM|nr:hypothetical protein [Candidatus Copromorpha excrementigallinarum]
MKEGDSTRNDKDGTKIIPVGSYSDDPREGRAPKVEKGQSGNFKKTTGHQDEERRSDRRKRKEKIRKQSTTSEVKR